MAGLIWVTQEDSWMITGSGYVPLLQRVATASDSEADRHALFQPEIFQTLNFDRLDEPQRTRLGRAVARAAEELHEELQPSENPRGQVFATRYAEIAARLRKHFG
jgi:hypothetical protein